MAKRTPYFVGTISDMIDAGLAIGGQRLGQPELSVLTRIGRETGFAQPVDSLPQPDGQRGKPATIWALDGTFKMQLEAIGKRRGRKPGALRKATEEVEEQVAEKSKAAAKAATPKAKRGRRAAAEVEDAPAPPARTSNVKLGEATVVGRSAARYLKSVGITASA